MTSLYFDTAKVHTNPLDIAEEILTQKEWPFERLSNDDLAFELIGTWSDIRVWLSWKPEIGSLIISCNFENKVPEKIKEKVYCLLGIVNERLWFGHFELNTDDSTVNFRYTLIAGDKGVVSIDQIDQMLTQAYHECERFYPALQSVIWGGKEPVAALEAAIFETVGEA